MTNKVLRKVSSLSKEFVWANITELNSVNISAVIIELAITPYGIKPVSTDWLTPGVSESPSLPVRRVALLVGPGGGVLVLTEGTYDLWRRVTDSPEVSIDRVGSFEVD